jgi:hypothetical protein
MVLAEHAASTGGGGHRTDREAAVGVGGMPEQQAQDLAACVAAGAGNRHSYNVGHSDDCAWLCSRLQIHSTVGGVAASTARLGSHSHIDRCLERELKVP